MARDSEFAAFVRELLAPLGGVSTRPMFGGFGVYCDGVFFGLIASDVLYFKVDETSRRRYEAHGLSQPFKPFEDRPYSMAYYEAPSDLFDDQEALLEWAREALAIARRAPAKKPARGPRPEGGR